MPRDGEIPVERPDAVRGGEGRRVLRDDVDVDADLRRGRSAISAAIAAKSVGVANVVIVTSKPLEPAAFISDFAFGRSYFSYFVCSWSSVSGHGP